MGDLEGAEPPVPAVGRRALGRVGQLGDDVLGRQLDAGVGHVPAAVGQIAGMAGDGAALGLLAPERLQARRQRGGVEVPAQFVGVAHSPRYEPIALERRGRPVALFRPPAAFRATGTVREIATGGYKRAAAPLAGMTDVEPHDVPDEAVAMLQEYLEDEHTFLSWLGFTVEEFEAGRMVGTIPFDEKLTNPTEPPTVQGGVASTLIDVVGGIALRPYLADPVEDDLATINLTVNYLRPATGDLTATAEVVRAGNSVGVSAVEVESATPAGETALVAVGQGAFRLFRS